MKKNLDDVILVDDFSNFTYMLLQQELENKKVSYFDNPYDFSQKFLSNKANAKLYIVGHSFKHAIKCGCNIIELIKSKYSDRHILLFSSLKTKDEIKECRESKNMIHLPDEIYPKPIRYDFINYVKLTLRGIDDDKKR